jgi:large subunit ribosomal protein L4
MIAAALRGVLSDRVRDGKLYVLDALVQGEVPSTKAALAALAAIGDYRSAIVVLHRDEDVAWLSLRNLAGVHAIAVDQLNVYDVIVNESVVFTTKALDAFINGAQSGKSAKAVATSTEAEAVAAVEELEEKQAKAEKPVKAEKAAKPAKAEKAVETTVEDAASSSAEEAEPTAKAEKGEPKAKAEKAEPKAKAEKAEPKAKKAAKATDEEAGK